MTKGYTTKTNENDNADRIQFSFNMLYNKFNPRFLVISRHCSESCKCLNRDFVLIEIVSYAHLCESHNIAAWRKKQR